jgi:Protein of unknown function (DUF3717)
MAGIHITDIEAAINWWRERSPSPDGISACAEVRAMAEVYALMVYHPRRALHRHLQHQPGRRQLQGLRPQLRRGAALAGLHAG